MPISPNTIFKVLDERVAMTFQLFRPTLPDELLDIKRSAGPVQGFIASTFQLEHPLACAFWVILGASAFYLAIKSFLEQLQSLQWLLNGPRLLSRNYVGWLMLASGQVLIRSQRYSIPFRLRTPERTYLFLSSREHIKELSSSPEKEFSLVAIAQEVSASDCSGTSCSDFEDLSTETYHEWCRDEWSTYASQAASQDVIQIAYLHSVYVVLSG